ncbi:MAG: hypothetical protein JWM36_2187 [Hyphomicrobiales bacterium]|nr:hypothetical protein [Hyphomicrobiales bacterium]
MLLKSRSLKQLFAGLVLVGCQALLTAHGALAQPRPLTISPSGAAAPPGVVTFTDREGSWDRVPTRALFTTGPQYPTPSGVRLGRGTLIPNWVEMAPLRDVSIRGLRRGSHYGYFVSPDRNVVVVNPSSRRVARVVAGR